MIFGFLFWLFFVGIVVASLQDLKRREVDNWLNLFLLITSFTFIFYKAIFEKDVTIIFQAGFALVIMFGFMNVFYYGRIFAGGDAKLLIAMTAFFIGISFDITLINIGIFLLFLIFSGSIYGMVYSLVLYIKNYKKINIEVRRGFDILWVRCVIILGFIMFVLSYVSWFFLLPSIFIFLLPLFYIFARGIEKVSMVKNLSGKNLREGDWLVSDVNVGSKTIRADWDGLSLSDIKLLKNKKCVKIKEGLPFVPAFLIAFLMFVFLKKWFVEFLFGMA